MKRTTLLFSFLFLSLATFAQTNFFRLSVGGGAGTTLAYADLKKKTYAFAGYGVIDYYTTPYVSFGLEIQKGELAGGDVQYDINHRQFINSYLSGSLNLKVQLGEFLTGYDRRNIFLNSIRGLYLGAGIGGIRNKLSNVRYYGDDVFPGEDQSTEMIVPVNLGINFYIPDQWDRDRLVINFNLQSTMAMGEGMDGYSSSNKNDIYTYFSVGVRYNFGILGLDRRR
ncbi:outer membrane beta-barrel protein [Pedobacter sp. KR3-3]|uniref:Outer membrane beta-barrel protein n=1 Tax=Pedobacter albus TaxID=3113905 RepID=A0ABU7IA25_9SPHI|nr:outer membrane beta-barrel protein [Pedobacter sp. KR3-3]MEE1946313.1 outer membrane beta-barrel protein [Pedobacter sp. KR3-3]